MNRPERTSWKEIRKAIHGRLLNADYLPGDRLPRDEDWARELGCSRATVQRAMRDLAVSGAVERRRKGGTFVSVNPVTRATLDIPITRLEVEEKGALYGYQLVDRKMVLPPANVAARLGLSRARRLLRIEALHFADHRPYLFEDRWVCPQTVPDIADVDLETESANEWLVRNKPFSRADLRFYAIAADDRLGGLLDAEPGAALFVIERTTWIGDAPITTVTAVTAPGYQLLTQIQSATL